MGAPSISGFGALRSHFWPLHSSVHLTHFLRATSPVFLCSSGSPQAPSQLTQTTFQLPEAHSVSEGVNPYELC